MKEDHIFLSNGRVQKKKKINEIVETLNSGRMAVHIAWAKIPEHKGSIQPSSFYGQLPN